MACLDPVFCARKLVLLSSFLLPPHATQLPHLRAPSSFLPCRSFKHNFAVLFQTCPQTAVRIALLHCAWCNLDLWLLPHREHLFPRLLLHLRDSELAPRRLHPHLLRQLEPRKLFLENFGRKNISMVVRW